MGKAPQDTFAILGAYFHHLHRFPCCLESFNIGSHLITITYGSYAGITIISKEKPAAGADFLGYMFKKSATGVLKI